MALTINTNVSSMLTQQSLTKTSTALADVVNKMATGRRINTARDDAAGLAISESMISEIRGLKQASRNGNDGISLIQTAEGSLDETLSLLQRMRELATQGSSGTYSVGDLTNINTEYQLLLGEIDRVASTADFNGIPLLSAASTVSIQIGPNNTANDVISIALIGATSTLLGVSGSDALSNANAQAALTLLDTAITTVTTGLASLGASHSKLANAVNGNADREINLQAASGQITDADFAEESANLAKLQILQQSGAAMLAQANAAGQIVLKLLQ